MVLHRPFEPTRDTGKVRASARMEGNRFYQGLRCVGQKSGLAGITMTTANLAILQGEQRTPLLEGLHGRITKEKRL